jgi:Flp pilus assembly protein TadD
MLRAASAFAARRHEYGQAIGLAQRLLAVDPAPASGGTPARFLIGRLFTAGGDDANAAKIYRELLKDWPDDAGAMDDLAAALVRAGEPLAALPFARHAREVFPDSAGPAATLGWALLLAGHTDEAVAPLAEAARLAPDDPQLRYRLARAQTAFGARTDARNNVVAALQLNPNFPEAPAARALLMELTQ